ncbi:MAG: T9SS type A sorting domain-containing protein [Taibaiella sp.]|nr:T9SS type A sorting domain-containing protein [Taibaiella sp.]
MSRLLHLCARVTNVLVVILFCSTSHAQIITTYAGSSTLSVGDGGPATAAGLRRPRDLTFDVAGNLLISEESGARVRRVDVTTGIITTVAGDGTYVAGGAGDGGPATTAKVNPYEIECDVMGNLYISEGGGYKIRKVDASGIITTIAGTGAPFDSGDGGPATAAGVVVGGIETDVAGNIYFGTETGVRRIDATTGIISKLYGAATPGFSGDGGPATAAQFNNVCEVVLRNGNMYVVDRLNYRIRKIDAAGIVTTVAGNGVSAFAGDGGPATAASFNGHVWGLDVDEAECIYIAEPFSNRIRKVNAMGIINTIAGNGTVGASGDGGPATAAPLYRMSNIAKRAGCGDLFIAVSYGNTVRMVTDHNNPAYFTGGHSLSLVTCVPSVDLPPVPVSLNTLLTAMDADTVQPLKWQFVSAPAHGSAAVAYSTFTTGGVVVPTGLTYTPAIGFTGYDTFRVRVTDAYSADTAWVYVRVDGPANAGTLTGADTVCKGGTTTFISSVAGGVFSTTTGNATASSGTITGITEGMDTVVYIFTNSCGSDTVVQAIEVKDCPAGIGEPQVAGNDALQLWPSPASGSVSILLSSAIGEAASVVITNVVGQVVKEFNITTNRSTEMEINVPPGVYTVSAITPHGRMVRQLVVR